MIATLKKAAGWYLKSLMLAVWSGICVAIGAAWMFLAVVAVLKSHGIDVL